MIEFAVCALTGAIIAMAGVYVGLYCRPGSKDAKKEEVPAKMEETTSDREEEQRSRKIDEGIQNLLTYSVNGHDGFEVGDL